MSIFNNVKRLVSDKHKVELDLILMLKYGKMPVGETQITEWLEKLPDAVIDRVHDKTGINNHFNQYKHFNQYDRATKILITAVRLSLPLHIDHKETKKQLDLALIEYHLLHV